MIKEFSQYEYTNDYKDIPIDLRNTLAEKANLFYSEQYYHYITQNGGKVLYFYTNDIILMAYIMKKYVFRWVTLLSEPFVYGDIDSSGMKSFLNAFVQLCKSKGFDWIGPTAATAFFECSPDDAIEIPFGSHVIDLENDVDTLWKNVHSKHRNVIRNAEKKGVKIVCGGKELLNDYVSIDIETWERSGRKSVISNYCEKMLDAMPDNVKVYMAYHDDQPQSGAIFLQNPQMSYYMYGASRNNPLTGAANLLHWVAINDAKEAGIKKYSFVGCRINEDEDSKYHGIQRFKGRFGGELIVGKMFKVILKPYKYELYKWLKVKRDKTEVKDVIDQEIHKWQ